MELSNCGKTRVSKCYNSSVLPIPSSKFSGDWRSSSEVFAIDLFVLTLQIFLVIASVAYFSRAIEGLATTEKERKQEKVFQNLHRSSSSFSKPQDYLDYVKKLEKVDNAKDCWLSLTHGLNSYPNCPLATEVQNALLLGKSNTVNRCWELINNQDLHNSAIKQVNNCIQ